MAATTSERKSPVRIHRKTRGGGADVTRFKMRPGLDASGRIIRKNFRGLRLKRERRLLRVKFI